MNQADIFKAIVKERKRQDDKWGPMPRNISHYEWVSILVEEVGEVAEAVLKFKTGEWLEDRF